MNHCLCLKKQNLRLKLVSFSKKINEQEIFSGVKPKVPPLLLTCRKPFAGFSRKSTSNTPILGKPKTNCGVTFKKPKILSYSFCTTPENTALYAITLHIFPSSYLHLMKYLNGLTLYYIEMIDSISKSQPIISRLGEEMHALDRDMVNLLKTRLDGLNAAFRCGRWDNAPLTGVPLGACLDIKDIADELLTKITTSEKRKPRLQGQFLEDLYFYLDCHYL